jgi:alanyl-tRNA synthetase
MTERLYFADPYRQTFGARVVERLQWGGSPAVVLDQTAFYPTGGGQPHDAGWLSGVPVGDVVERETDGAVVHVLSAPLDGETVEGKIDWARRFDLMQQHTGQHILSAAFVERCGANTVGFHLSDAYATLDVDRAPLSAEDLAQVEVLSNDVVFRDRPAIPRFVPDGEVSSLPLRKPVSHKGPVRVVEIPGFDCSACGGTHVRRTGEVGLVKITRSERRGHETRVEFLCGRRALADYQSKNALVMGLAQEYTVGHWELADLVHRLAGDLKETRRDLRRTRDALLDAEATALWYEGVELGPARIVRAEFSNRAPDDLKHLARRLVGRPCTVALLGTVEHASGKATLAFARTPDLELHMGNLVRQACERIGGRGGGRPEFAQGGGPRGDNVSPALDRAYQSVVNSIEQSYQPVQDSAAEGT